VYHPNAREFEFVRPLLPTSFWPTKSTAHASHAVRLARSHERSASHRGWENHPLPQPFPGSSPRKIQSSITVLYPLPESQLIASDAYQRWLSIARTEREILRRRAFDNPLKIWSRSPMSEVLGHAGVRHARESDASLHDYALEIVIARATQISSRLASVRGELDAATRRAGPRVSRRRDYCVPDDSSIGVHRLRAPRGSQRSPRFASEKVRNTESALREIVDSVACRYKKPSLRTKRGTLFER